MMYQRASVYDYINLHTYHYAGNNPIRYIDPDGEVKWDQLFSGVLEIGSGVMSLIGAKTMIGGTVASGGAAAIDIAQDKINPGLNVLDDSSNNHFIDLKPLVVE